ncbi:MAG: sensor histidine kinase, partial [Gaiellaceae bacterium]
PVEGHDLAIDAAVGPVEPADRVTSRALGAARAPILGAVILGVLLNSALVWRVSSSIDELQNHQIALLRQARVLEGKIPALLNDGRGFLLTGDERYVTDFEDDADDARAAIRELRALATEFGDPAPLDRIAEGLERAILGVQERIALARSGQVAEAATAFALADTDKRAVLQLFDAFVAGQEDQLLGLADALKRDLMVGAVLSATLLLAAAAFGIWFLRNSRLEAEASERRLAAAGQELFRLNSELETFNYSVSHDLRAPLRSVDGFSVALIEDHGDVLPQTGRQQVGKIRAAAKQMSALIDGLLDLSRITRRPLRREPVDLSTIARDIAGDLRRAAPERAVEVVVAQGMRAQGDPALIRLVLQNLLGNAWKFTSNRASARIEVGRTSADGTDTFFVRDNGAGFDMSYADKLFGVFQRLHRTDEFEGTGIGLATVQRIVHRHGGRVWAEGAVDQGATFSFRLSEQP